MCDTVIFCANSLRQGTQTITPASQWHNVVVAGFSNSLHKFIAISWLTIRSDSMSESRKYGKKKPWPIN